MQQDTNSQNQGKNKENYFGLALAALIIGAVILLLFLGQLKDQLSEFQEVHDKIVTLATLSGWKSIVVGEETPADLTTGLLRAVATYNKAAAGEKAGKLRVAMAYGAKRRQVMKNLIKTDPGKFLLHALPAVVRDYLPVEVAGFVEKHVSKTGRFDVLHLDNFIEGRGELLYFLIGQSGNRKEILSLSFAKNPPRILSGSTVEISGVQLNRQMVLAEGGGESFNTLAASTADTAGPQKTLAITINGVRQTWARKSLFTDADSVATFYREVSFDTVSITGDVVGPYTIAADGCNNRYAAADGADEAARADGIDVDSYPRRFYILTNITCGNYAGIATVGGNPSRSWIYKQQTPTYTHEYGHNIGVRHASSGSCSQTDGTCSKDSEYGEISDVMGRSSYYHQWNGPHKLTVGWILPANATTVPSSGTFSIAPTEVRTSAFQLLKIDRPYSADDFYVSYRQRQGTFDSDLPSALTQGAHIHFWNGDGMDQTKQITSNSALADGGSIKDSFNGITITQVSHSPDQVVVSVSITSTECPRPTPTLTVTPISQSGTSGKKLSYQVTVTNNDAAGCTGSTFRLSLALPAGFTGTFGISELNVPAGSSRSTTLSLTSLQGAADGSYQFDITATDTSLASRSVTTQATYVVFNDTVPPTVTITKPKNGSRVGRSTTIEISASDDRGLARVELRLDSILAKTFTEPPYSYVWETRSLTKGTHYIQAFAIDNGANSANHIISVKK